MIGYYVIVFSANLLIDFMYKEKYAIRWLKYTRSIQKNEEGSLQYKRSLEVNEGYYPKDAYKSYRQFFKDIAKHDNAKVVLIKK